MDLRPARCLLGVPLTVLVLLGCPAEVKNPAPERPKKTKPVVDESDPRVVKDGEDLYAADALPEPASETKAKGSGKPDTSNGFCQLYAPKLPEPHCCETEYGFDAEATRTACGKSLYLGESFQRSCGYYFHDAALGESSWFRTSFINAASPKEAAEAEANRIKLRFGAEVEVEPMPGTPGAYQLHYAGLGYAWMTGDPAWPNVRRLAWKDEVSCSQEGLQAVVAQMAAAKAPPKGARRLDLVPKARQ